MNHRIKIFSVVLLTVLSEAVVAADRFYTTSSFILPSVIFLVVISSSLLIFRFVRLINLQKNVNEKSGGKSEDFSQSLIDISPDAIIVVNEDMRIEKFNLAAEKVFGFTFEKIENKPFIGTLISEKNKATFDKFLSYCKNKNDSALHSIHLDFIGVEGVEMTTSARIAVSKNQGRCQFILHIQDKSRQLEAEDRLHYATYNDDLTGLPNRHIAAQHIYQGIADAKRKSRLLVVMKVGLDRFKHINESLGHDAGDKLLIEISSRLQENIRRGDLVSRINGDQFVITLVDIDKNTNLDTLVRKYTDSFAQPFYVEDHTLHVSVSIGIACYPEDATNVDGLLRNAESAMFQAKQKGGTGFRYYSREMRQVSKERLYLENELRRAIIKNELDVFYQPQVDLKTGKIIGVEALIRWKHPDLGMVSPIKFIPVAEEIGLISEIGRWVMKRSCADMALLRKTHSEYLRLSINLSANQFQDDDLVESIASILNETAFPPENLELEITESLFMEDLENVARTLEVLSLQGIRISMDDFGTGYSSLSYLKRFPINTIKVDRSFVKDITTDKDDASIVSATIQMAHSLSLDIVAEGVETEEQLRFLLSQKCDKMQGYYFSRPLSYKALVNLLKENRQIELNSDKICLISGYR